MIAMPKVFLGGTVNGSMWRDYVMPQLKIDYFNPVVEEWNEAAYQVELREREHCDYCVYVLTPKMTGVYSIAEVIDDSNKRPERTIYCMLLKDEEQEFTKFQGKSLRAVGRMVESNGGRWFESLDDLVNFLNKQK